MADWFSVLFTFISIVLVPPVRGLRITRGLFGLGKIGEIHPPTGKADPLASLEPEVDVGPTGRTRAGGTVTRDCSAIGNAADMGNMMSEVTESVLIGLIVTVGCLCLWLGWRLYKAHKAKKGCSECQKRLLMSSVDTDSEAWVKE
ncbi:hypothetical protein AAF712_009937 [Marasmius tenuissimus]|uniref:Uncharacterized protein n=1 Tax=Marasmius tenuissimus TaxID=585030 RepID=A0ABR2ZS28_9AGAR